VSVDDSNAVFVADVLAVDGELPTTPLLALASVLEPAASKCHFLDGVAYLASSSSSVAFSGTADTADGGGGGGT
jgi:hypothetical protein